VRPRLRPLLTAAALALTATLPGGAAWPESLAGSYLAANQASYSNDYKAAATYYARALAQDPSNPALLQNALLSFIGTGDFTAATAIATRMQGTPADSQLAQLVVIADMIRRDDFGGVADFFEEGAEFSPLLDGLVKAWVQIGRGRMSDALEEFDALAGNSAMTIFADYHRALALAMVGDFEGAALILDGPDGRPLRIGRGSLEAHVRILSQLDRSADAIAAIDQAMNGSGDLELLDYRARLEAGETLPYAGVTTPMAGIAEVFLNLASILQGEDNDRFGLIYGRLAEMLRPDSAETLLLVAEILSDQGQYDLAVHSLNNVPADSPSFYNAEIGRAQALQSAGRIDAAIEVLRGLARSHATIPSVFTALGDALRRNSDFGEAAKAYDAAIQLLPDPQPNHWFIYYARGISYEREGDWDQAEADFRFALELSPEQPLVLNYLGYGMVEKRINLDEAQMMIEKAVERRPNDGYITDSLGWVLYRVGKFDEAVPHMERAVELMPVDPIINDHLGDVYWMVGRTLEARFQWRRALSFDPEPTEAERIRKKLDLGLDEVLRIEAETTE
jgi:tetratricopeptide (TPR) repeat protein